MGDASVFSLPQVQNWKRNIVNGNNDENYFWDEAIYSFTKIYDSFEPFMRFCVDMRIEGKKPKDIAGVSKKSVRVINQTLYRAKDRLLKAIG